MTAVLTMTDQAQNLEFAAYVRELTGGRPAREVSRATRATGHYVNPTTIGDMLWGTPPTFKTLDKFAKGLALSEEQTAKLFRLAKLAPPSGVEESDFTGRAIYERGVDALVRKLGRSFATNYSERDLDAMTVDQAYAEVAHLFRLADEGKL